MGKYIDADKLIDGIKHIQGKFPVITYDALLHLVTSLQQEQPEGLHFIPLIRLIQKIPFKNWNNTVNNYAKKLRDCFIKEGYLKDAKVLQDYISYMNGNNVPMATMDEQKQPEMDLKKEIDEKWDEFVSSEGEREDFTKIARHFFELGLKAKLDSVKQPEVDLEKELDKLVAEEFASHSRATEYGLEVTYNRAELYQLFKRMALAFGARKED